MIIEVEWDTDDDEVKKALNYLVGFKEEMTSDKKHYTGVLIREVKRLRDLVEFAIAAIDSNHCYMGEEAQVDLRDYLKEMIE